MREAVVQSGTQINDDGVTVFFEELTDVFVQHLDADGHIPLQSPRLVARWKVVVNRIDDCLGHRVTSDGIGSLGLACTQID